MTPEDKEAPLPFKDTHQFEPVSDLKKQTVITKHWEMQPTQQGLMLRSSVHWHNCNVKAVLFLYTEHECRFIVTGRETNP